MNGSDFRVPQLSNRPDVRTGRGSRPGMRPASEWDVGRELRVGNGEDRVFGTTLIKGRSASPYKVAHYRISILVGIRFLAIFFPRKSRRTFASRTALGRSGDTDLSLFPFWPARHFVRSTLQVLPIGLIEPRDHSCASHNNDNSTGFRASDQPSARLFSHDPGRTSDPSEHEAVLRPSSICTYHRFCASLSA